MRGLHFPALLLASLATASGASAQSAPAVVTGRVTDATTGEPLAGVDVRLFGGDTLRAVTDARGVWRVVAAGTRYDVNIRALGFRARRAPLADARDVALTPLPFDLDRVVVTAAKREQTLADVVVTTELVSKEDIVRTGASDLGSALASHSGIELQSGVPAGVGLTLQGLGGARVLVLLDGQPLPGRIGGDFDVSRIPTSMVERIEIVKGPQSTLYGTDAMGGVVNIITRPSDVGRTLAGASAIVGSRNRRDGSVFAGGTRGPLTVRGDLGHRSLETAPGRTDEQGALSTRIDGAANVKWQASSSKTVEASLLALDERQRWLGGTLYNFADNQQFSGRLGGEWSFGNGGRLRATSFASVYDHLSRASSQPQPIRGDTGQRQVQRLFQEELAYTRPIAAHVLDLGLLLRRDDIESVRVPGGRRAVTIEPLAQLEAAITPKLSVIGGSRLSRSDRWGTRLTPRVAVRYRPVPSFSVRASLGSGFRAPDFRELYMRFSNDAVGYAVLGNENLRPESSRNAMLGTEWIGADAWLRTQLFWNEFDDFIETRIVSAPDAPPVYEYANLDNGFTRGAELEGGVSFGRARAEAGYTLLRTADRATGQPLLGRARDAARASLSHPLPLALRFSATGVYTGRAPMTRDDAGAIVSWRDAYPRLDLRLARAIRGGAEVSLSVENVLDRRPAEWAGFVGRQLFAGLRWNATR
jgi:outer membrane receptor for ferrienterochelin and colicins